MAAGCGIVLIGDGGLDGRARRPDGVVDEGLQLQYAQGIALRWRIGGGIVVRWPALGRKGKASSTAGPCVPATSACDIGAEAATRPVCSAARKQLGKAGQCATDPARPDCHCRRTVR